MIVTVAKSEREFYTIAAMRIAMQLIAKPDSVAGFATGRTTGGIHQALAGMHSEKPFDTSKLTAFPMDEVVGVTPEFPGSCVYMILHEVVLPLGIPEKNYIYLPTRSDDFIKACKDFTDALEARGGIDFMELGIGENGHLGFNQPGTPFGQTATVSWMMPELEERLRKESGTPEDVKMGGVTLGIRDIMGSRRILLVANGAHKAAVIKAVLTGPVTEDVPASVLQLHPDCEIVLDPAAASLL